MRDVELARMDNSARKIYTYDAQLSSVRRLEGKLGCRFNVGQFNSELVLFRLNQ